MAFARLFTCKQTPTREKTNQNNTRPKTRQGNSHVHQNVLDFNLPFICMRSVWCYFFHFALVLSLFIRIQLSIHGSSCLLMRKVCVAYVKCEMWNRLFSWIFIYTWRCKSCFISVLLPLFHFILFFLSPILMYVCVYTISLFWEWIRKMCGFYFKTPDGLPFIEIKSALYSQR